MAKLSCGVFKMLKSNKGDSTSYAVYEELEPFKIWRRMNLCPSFYMISKASSFILIHASQVPSSQDLSETL